jgi:putative membrane protein
MYGYGCGIGFFGWLLPFFFFIICIVMVALFFRRGGMPRMMSPMCGHHRHHGESVSAKEILERRYARGEIGREEYQKIKQDLESK